MNSQPPAGRSILSPASIAAIVPRYGANLGGGAETLVRELILRLKRRYEDERLAAARARNEEPPGEPIRFEVWTTCALDHRSWDNELPPGITTEDGIVVRRFPVSPRNLDIFIGAELAMRDGRPLTVDEQLEWMSNSVNSHELYRHIATHGKSFDLLLFAPYLFATTFWGSLIHPERSVLIPCLHDESYAYLEVIRHMMLSVRGLIFNALPEQQLAWELYGEEPLRPKSAVVGMGFDPVEPSHHDAGTVPSKPFLLYSGRKEEGKNLHLLIEWFTALRPRVPELELVLIGSGTIGFLQELPQGVIDLGFVSSEEKRRLQREALALCQLSTNESFSIVMMEAWREGTPVIVHAECAVTRHHVVTSGGGLYCANGEEFAAVVRHLLENPALRDELGNAGRSYVQTEYDWKAVLDRLEHSFTSLGYF